MVFKGAAISILKKKTLEKREEIWRREVWFKYNLISKNSKTRIVTSISSNAN